MSVISLFTAKGGPTFGALSFEAVFEDNLELSVDVTNYAIESGARVADHRIVNPIKYGLRAAVSNTPLAASATDFITGGLSNLTNNPYVNAATGLLAGFLTGSDEGRAGATLETLVKLMTAGDPFTVNCGDITLQNMVITRITRPRTPANENGLEFTAELQELITLDRIWINGQPTQSILFSGDKSSTSISGVISKGEKALRDVGSAINTSVSNVLGSIF